MVGKVVDRIYWFYNSPRLGFIQLCDSAAWHAPPDWFPSQWEREQAGREQQSGPVYKIKQGETCHDDAS